MSWIVPSPLSLRQAPDMSVVVLVLEVLLVVVVDVVVGTLVVVGSAHDGAPSVQLHSPDLQKNMMPCRQSRFAFFLKPAHRALIAGLQRLRLHGFFRASTGDADTPSPNAAARASPNARPRIRAADLPYCVMSPFRGRDSGTSSVPVHVSRSRRVRQSALLPPLHCAGAGAARATKRRPGLKGVAPP